jgi:transcriptional regulator with XRE-family HTH domain
VFSLFRTALIISCASASSYKLALTVVIGISAFREYALMNPKSSLRQAREMRGWSQARVAQTIGADVGTISRWERGICTPSPYFREKLCLLFEMDAHELGFLKFELPPASTIQRKPAIVDPLIPRPPVANPGLIGRDVLLKQLISLLLAGDTCALFGLPGSGKTALVLALVRHKEILAHFIDGILWVGLGQSPDVYSHLSHWATLIGISTTTISRYSTIESLSYLLRQMIGTRCFLLVVDDAWKIADTLPFLIGGPACTQLITTRSPLLARTIAANTSISVPILGEQESLQLLTAYVPAISHVDKQIISPLVQQIGGLPFMLSLIGKNLQVEAQSGQPRRLYAALASLSERSTRLHLSFPRTPTERHSTSQQSPASLDELIAVSTQHLSLAASATLPSLSLLPTHPDSFSETAMIAVTDTLVDILDELLDAGLLESSGSGHYYLHRAIVDYIHYHSDPPAEARRRLIDYGLHYAIAHEDDFPALESEYGVIVKALEEAYQAEVNAKLVQGACAIVRFLYRRQSYRLAEYHLYHASIVSMRLGDPFYRGYILYHQGELAAIQGNHLTAQKCYEEGLILARQSKNFALEKELLDCLSRIVLISLSYNTTQNVTVEVAHVEVNTLFCPFCQSLAIQKRGKTHAGTQRYYCRNCERSFTQG